jgi:iron complex transport system permease protein
MAERAADNGEQWDVAAAYRKHLRRKVLVGACLAAALGAGAIISLSIGAFSIGPGDLLRALLAGPGETVSRHVLWSIRLPRVLAALLGGGCLALAGTVMQNVLRNPLASPFTLGVSQGAAFGAAFAIIALGAGGLSEAGAGIAFPAGPGVIVASAFAGSLVTVVVLLLLSAARQLSPAAMILAGVALGSFFGASTMLLQYFGTELEVAAALFWTFGDLGKGGWDNLWIMAAALFPAAAFFVWKRWQFNKLLWGDDTAESLGVRVARLRLCTLVLAALMSSVTTAFLGIIGFVGLVAPHLVRMVVGQDHRFLVPYSIIAGGLLLAVSDILARTILSPVVLPVGILTAFAGTPLFLYLLISRGEIRQ